MSSSNSTVLRFMQATENKMKQTGTVTVLYETMLETFVQSTDMYQVCIRHGLLRKLAKCM
jgi:hypothetical protein